MDIPDRVKSIGSSAFYYCTSLDSVSLPKELKNIEDKTFYGCNLSTIAIPEKVVEIGTYAFYDNPLTSIIIPDSVMTVGSNAFSNCYNLKTVGINSSDIIANGKYKDVFGGQVTTYILGGGIKTLPDFLFFNYTNLKSVTLPDSLTSIGESAFENCTSLDSIVLPINVSEIGAYAFANCASLKYIACNNPVPPICDMDVFYEVRTDASSLEVLSSVVDVYSKTAPWNDFNIIGVVIPTRMDIIDGEVYDNKKELSMDTITYTRTFNNTNWQALYLPFSMNYSDWSEDFDVAKINDIHQFDEDNDNALDRTIMEVVKIMGGTLIPNHPYMIRAKSTGTKTITVENATLMPAESNSIDCSSVEREYVFTGTYTGVDGETMVENMYYAMSGGGVKYSTNTSVSLKPFRWYMQIKDRKGQVINDIAEAKVIVRGEEDWDITGIEDVKTESGKFVIYSIGGTLVRNVKADNINQATEGLSEGMYIINGKKHFIK